MPIYEFECARCGEQFEELIRSAVEEKILLCPKCHGRKIRRLFSAFGFKSGSKAVSSLPSAGQSCRTCAAKTCDTCR
ncbi:MAG: zinc ribbon domain-containing protein [bacterium]